MSKRLTALVIFLILVVLIILTRLFWPAPKRPPILLTNGSGLETTEFQMHDSILFEAVNLSPRTGYQIRLIRDDGVPINELTLSTDAEGIIPQTVLWYNVGVLSCPSISSRAPETVRTPAFDLMDSANRGRTYSVRILQKDTLVREMEFRVANALQRPTLYASDWRGCPKSGFLIGEDDVWVIGKNFPKGSIIRVWTVPASSNWRSGDRLSDQTKQHEDLPPPVFELRAEDTDFIRKLWPREMTSLGSYDIVAEVITYDGREYRPVASARVQDYLFYPTYSGFVIQRRPGAAQPLEVDIAGSVQSPYTFRNTFLTTENVYVGVDPVLQPTYVGKTADVYIVPDHTNAWWTVSTNVNLGALDVTGGIIETITVGGICGNCWKTLAWSAPLVVGEYDVVLDFNRDGFYTPGVDLIDSLDPAGFVVAEVRVENISFNYGGSGGITIRDNVNKTDISAPEYYSANHIVKPAAWVMGGSHSVQVSFKAVPAVSSVKIWAESGFGGLNSAGSPVSVTFSGGSGQGTLNVNSVPSTIGKNEFFWNWKYKNVNGAATPETSMGETGRHVVYAVYAAPKAPMVKPWLDVLEYATNWASGETSAAGAVARVVSGIYNSGMVYNGNQHHTRPDYSTFYLNEVFTQLRTPGMTVYMDCRDCANLFHVTTNALGFSHQYLVIPGSFTFKPILPMGQSSCAGGQWSFHQVGWCGSQVADASAKMSCTISSVCDYSAADYINLLTATSGIGPGSTGICSPQE